MEASLLQAYSPRDPLAEYLRGEITLRKLRVMVEAIPIDASTPVGRKIVGPWDALTHLTWAGASAMRNLSASYHNVHKREGVEPVTPEPLPTPPLTEYQLAEQDAATKKQREEEAALLAAIQRR